MADVKFIRKNGRIIPIKIKDKGKLKSGSAALAGGAALATTSGYVAGRMFKTANATSDFIERSVDVAADLMKKTKKTRKTGIRIPKGQMSFAELNIEAAAKSVPKYKRAVFSSAKTIKYAGFGLGTLLVGAGLQKVYEGITGKDSGIHGDVISAVAGFGAVKLAQRGFKKGMGKALLKALSKGKIK